MRENASADQGSRGSTMRIGILLALLLLGALYLRTNGLRELDLGFDEAMHTYAAIGILEKGEPVMPSGFTYRRALPFTYSVALSFKLLGRSEVSSRIPSILFGLFSVLLVFFIGKDFFGTTAGFVAAILMAYLPFEIVWSRACRMYSMYQFFFLLSFFTFYKGIEHTTREQRSTEDTRKKAWFKVLDIHIPILAFSFLVLYLAYRIHSLITVFYFSVTLYFACMYIIGVVTEGEMKGERKKYLIYLAIWGMLGLGGLLMPGTARLIKEQVQFLPVWATYLNRYPGYYYGFLQSQSLFPVLVFFVLGSIQILIRFRRSGYYILICTIIPFFLHSFVSNVQRPRYIYDIFPLIILISSYAISNFFSGEVVELRSRINREVEKGYRRKIGYAIVLSCCFLVMVIPYYKGMKEGARIDALQAYDFGGEYHAEWRRACEYVGQYYEPGDVMIASIPLAAEFAGCHKVEYNLDNGEIDQFKKIAGERWQRHVFADAKCIIDLKDFKEVMALHKRAWLVIDALRFRFPGSVSREVKNFIKENLNEHVLEGSESIHIFSWDRGSGEESISMQDS